MSHQIYVNKQGKASFASAIEPAWHGLGQILPNIMTAAEAIEAAGLDYQIEKRRLYTFDNDNANPDIKNIMTQTANVEIPGFYATVRTDTSQPLGIVGENYQVVQNKNCFRFFDSIVGEGAAIYETAGVLGEGQRIFITAKLPQQIIVGDDCIENYLFLTTSHDGTAGIRAAFTPTRIVCANTLAIALKDAKHMIHIKHTANANYAMEQAHIMMGITLQRIETLEETYNAMRKYRISDSTLQDLLLKTFEPSDGMTLAKASKQLLSQVQNVMEYNFNHETQDTKETKGTLYGFVNSVTGYFQNGKTWKSAERKLISTIEGSTMQSGNKAFNLAYDLISN